MELMKKIEERIGKTRLASLFLELEKSTFPFEVKELFFGNGLFVNYIRTLDSFVLEEK